MSQLFNEPNRVNFFKSKQQEKYNAVPIEESSTRLVNNDVPNNVNAIFKDLTRYRIMSIVSLLLLAGIGITILVVILTRRSSAEDALLEKIKSLLTNASRQELDVAESVPSLALSWLLLKSNFNEYSLDRQVQRFAMAAFYYSTKGRSWNESKGWLTNDDECTWYQSSNESVCVNGTLRVLSLKSNNLQGLLPNDIGLLTFLETLDLAGNEITDTEIYIYSNTLDGSIPVELVSVRILGIWIFHSLLWMDPFQLKSVNLRNLRI